MTRSGLGATENRLAIEDGGQHAKYLFVCGLHRSGTTVLVRSLGELRDCTSFRGMGVPMDEGQHLQSVYPTNDAYGGPGRVEQICP